MTKVRFARAIFTWMEGWEVEVHLTCSICNRFTIKKVLMDQIYVHKYIGCVKCKNGIDTLVEPDVTF